MKTLILLAAFIAFLYLLRKRSASPSDGVSQSAEESSGKRDQLVSPPSSLPVAPQAQVSPAPQMQSQLPPQLADEIANGLLEEPLVKVVLLARRIDRARSRLDSLAAPDKAEHEAELRIIKEQLRCAAFEKELLLSVFTGHHPNQSAIDTDWCFTAAELYLKFADERLKTLN
ncbi:MAG: hypothetical protein K2Y32_18230 [Candidatus Obscuribacterales bacterium]|nr:hypothetical protein [Candidatus Obscuribacterales bacterium]